MEVFLIIVAIIISILFFIVDIYLIAYYSHKDQSSFAPINIFCKIVILISLILTEFQPLFLILDVSSSRSSTQDFTMFWLILYIALLTNIALFKPIATSLYERDHDDPCWKVALWTIIQIFISFAVFGAFISIGWTFWGAITIPIDVITVDSSNSGLIQSSSNILMTSNTIEFNSSIVAFVVAFFCIIGYPLLSCCGACGLTVLPISLILQFVNRPKFRRTADARKVAQFLKVQTVRLLRQSQKLQRQMKRLQYADGFFERRRENNKFEKQLIKVEEQLQQQRDYYELFKMQMQMEKTNPIVFILKLILGILSAILSVMIWIQILLSQLVFPLSSSSGALFLDKFFTYMENQNASFVAVGFIMLISIYLVFCIIKGSMFFSNSIPFIIIHPIVESKTWLNSFIFHVSLCMLSACSLIHLLANTFPYYLRGGTISVLLQSMLSNIKMFRWLLKNKIFTYSFLIIGGLGVIYVSVKMLYYSQGKGQLLKRIQQKRLKLFGKQNQNKSLKFIEMTDMKLVKQ